MLLQTFRFNLSFVSGLNTSYSVIGIKKSSMKYSILKIINDLSLLILFLSFNMFSHSPKLIEGISLYSLLSWLNEDVIW